MLPSQVSFHSPETHRYRISSSERPRPGTGRLASQREQLRRMNGEAKGRPASSPGLPTHPAPLPLPPRHRPARPQGAGPEHRHLDVRELAQVTRPWSAAPGPPASGGNPSRAGHCSAEGKSTGCRATLLGAQGPSRPAGWRLRTSDWW